MQVLVADDSWSALTYLSRLLRDTIRDLVVDAFDNPLQALQASACRQYDLVLIDHIMPELDGIEFTKRLRTMDSYQSVPVIMVTSDGTTEIRREAIEAGATDFITKPFDSIELQARVRNLLAFRKAQIELASQATMLAAKVDETMRDLVAREEEVIWRLARAIQYRDGETGEHVYRVAQISRLIAEAIGMPADRCRTIYLAAPLHDVGKIGIEDAILFKPGKLTPSEMKRMQEHVGIGARILENGNSDIIRTAELIAQSHHERWDGKGYPDMLSGTDIPIEARIVALADVFDALCSERPYKKAWPLEKAYDEIISLSGTHFDPECVAAFKQKWPEIVAMTSHRSLAV